MSGIKYQRVLCTLHNSELALDTREWASYDEVVYVCGQLEMGVETKKLHWQFYMELKIRVGIKRLKEIIGDNSVHVESAKGTADQCMAYCIKEETSQGRRFEYGTMGQVKKGARNDLNSVRKTLAAGGNMRTVVGTSESFQGIRMAEKWLSYNEKKRDWKPEVIWIWGSTGTGKTKMAMEMAGEDVWVSGRDLRWWYDYDGHQCVVLDDFRADFCKFHELLRILDRYPFTIETKGGFRQLLAKKIIITSPYAPEEAYRGKTPEDVGQLTRRIDRIVKLEKRGDLDAAQVGGNTSAPPNPEEEAWDPIQL